MGDALVTMRSVIRAVLHSQSVRIGSVIKANDYAILFQYIVSVLARGFWRDELEQSHAVEGAKPAPHFQEATLRAFVSGFNNSLLERCGEKCR